METTTYTEIDRSAVPAGSFRYGQDAFIEGIDAPADKWLVCTDCAKAKNDADNGASGFDTVLVAHFILTREADAREVAETVTGATLVRPSTHGNPRRDLTAGEIAVRENVWAASQAGHDLYLNANEVAALHASILQTGRELSWLRDRS